MHCKAYDIDRRPTITLSQIYCPTPTGKAMASARSEEVQHLPKLFDIAYLAVKDEIESMTYWSHGVSNVSISDSIIL